MSDEIEPSKEPEAPPSRHHYKIQSRVVVTSAVSDPEPKTLVVTTEIACATCEFRIALHVPGHHLQAVIDQWRQVLVTYPELCVPHEIEDEAKERGESIRDFLPELKKKVM